MHRPQPRPAPFEVACAGVVCLDRLLETPRHPEPDEKVRATGLRLQPGGQAATAAVALARWGVRAQFLGSIGDDEAGRLCRAVLATEGVDVSGCRTIPHAATHQAFVNAEPGGLRTIVYHRAPELDATPFAEPSAGWVHLDGQDLDHAIAVARWCRERGVPVSLDLEGDPQGQSELIRLCDVVVADGPSGRHLSADPAEAARRLAGMGPWLAGVTLGERGACGWCEGEALWADALPVDVVDTTGAGDIFHAAVVFGLLRGWSPSRTWTFAAAAASLSCRALGGMPGIPALEEIPGG